MHDKKNSLSVKAVGSIAIAAMLVFGVFAYLPLMKGAFAQGANTITTSADSHGNKFFGPSMLEVRIQDPTLAADNTPSTSVPVSVTAFGNTASINVDETSGTSGTLLLYVHVHKSGVPTAPNAPASPLSATFTNLVIGTDNAAFTAGGGTNGKDVIAVIDSNVNEGGSIQFNYGGVTKTITYDDSAALISLDRTNFGPTATAYVVAEEQDANLDPTAVNTYTEVANGILTDGADHGGPFKIYTETGTNTAKFETTYTVGAIAGGASSTSRTVTVSDFKNYTSTGLGSGTGGLGSPVGTSGTSYTVQIVSGAFSTLGTVTYAGELPLIVSDSDRNLNSKAQETFNGALKIDQLAGSSAFNLREQSLSSSTLVPAYGNDRVKLTWKEALASNPATGILVLQPEDEATLKYTDANPAGNTTSLTIKPTNTAATLTSDLTTVGKSSVLKLTQTDPDLNDDAQIIESYTVEYDTSTSHADGTVGQAGDSPFPSGATPFSMKIDRNGASMPLSSVFAVTFTETGPNTGVFVAEVDMADLGAALNGAATNGEPLSDGDTIRIEVNDILESGTDNKVQVNLTVGLEKPTVSVDKSTVSVPRLEADDDNDSLAPGPYGQTLGAVQDDISNTGPIQVAVTIRDSNRNNSTTIEDELVAGGTPSTTGAANAASHAHSFDGGRLVLTLSSAPGTTFNAATTINIVDAIKETGFNTGVFQGTIEVTAGGANNDRPLWIGAKMKIEYKGLVVGDTSDDANSVTVTFTSRQAVLTTDTSTVVNGGKVTFTVNDQDSNRDTGTSESVFLRVQWTNSAGVSQDEWLELSETGVNTGVFTETVAVGDDSIGASTFTVEADSDVKIFYYDGTPNVSASKGNDWPELGTSTGKLEKTLAVGSFAGALDVDVTGGKVGPSANVDTTVFDTDENSNPNTKQTIAGLVTVATDRGISVTLDVEETDGNSGRFVGTINLIPDPTPDNDGVGTPSGTEVDVEVLPGDTVSVRYEDQNDQSGHRTTISKNFEIVSVDPEIKTNKDTFAVGDQMTISVADVDADEDPDSNDIKNVKVTSSSDLVGLSNVQLIETGPNTGVFEGTLTLSSEFSSGSLFVKSGDSVTIKYTDNFPADYKTRIDAGQNGNKDFLKTVKISGAAVTTGGSTGTSTPSSPILKDISGKLVTDVAAGSQVLLTTTIKNNEANARDFTAILDVRDSNGQTISLQFQTGTLTASGQISIGGSWTPMDPGTYKVRTFVLSELGTAAIILSPVAESTITVS